MQRALPAHAHARGCQQLQQGRPPPWPPPARPAALTRLLTEAALILMTVEHIVEGGRTARPMATACARDPRARESTPDLGIMDSKSAASTLGQGKSLFVKL